MERLTKEILDTNKPGEPLEGDIKIDQRLWKLFRLSDHNKAYMKETVQDMNRSTSQVLFSIKDPPTAK